MSFQIQYISIIITSFVTKMQAFFCFLIYFSMSFFVLIVFCSFKILFPFYIFVGFRLFSSIIYHNCFFLLVFYFLSSSFFSLNMHILCPTFGYIGQTIQKNQPTFYVSNVGIAKSF